MSLQAWHCDASLASVPAHVRLKNMPGKGQAARQAAHWVSLSRVQRADM
jgi:hypothetical protein